MTDDIKMEDRIREALETGDVWLANSLYHEAMDELRFCFTIAGSEYTSPYSDLNSIVKAAMTDEQKRARDMRALDALEPA